MLTVKTILHPTDFSPRSDQAFQLACSLARDYGAKLILLHIIERSPIIHSGVMMAAPATQSPDDERLAVLAELQQLQPCVPDVNIDRQLFEGEPSGAIIKLAQETAADLIVMGTHGRTGLGRLLMGSVAEKVLRGAPCPVLTIREPSAAE